MLYKIINSLPMGDDWESRWIPLNIDPISNFGYRAKAESLQIYWQNANGIYDGTLNIYCTNDRKSRSLKASIDIDRANNMDDSALIEVSSAFRYIKLEYINSQITGGQLSALLHIRDD